MQAHSSVCFSSRRPFPPRQPPPVDPTQIVLLAGMGLAAGFVAGLLGLGGGLIFGPVLLFFFGSLGVGETEISKLTAGSSLFCTLTVTSASAYFRHRTGNLLRGGPGAWGWSAPWPSWSRRSSSRRSRGTMRRLFASSSSCSWSPSSRGCCWERRLQTTPGSGASAGPSWPGRGREPAPSPRRRA
jgi:hypothetical protein